VGVNDDAGLTGILDVRLRPPRVRPGLVTRAALIDRLLADADTPIVAVEAPGGYGKSTLLVQWAMADSRPFAWLAVDRRHGDPRVLLAYLAEAIGRVADPEVDLRSALDGVGPSVWAAAVPRLAAAISGMADRFVLVLDEVDALPIGEAADAIVELADAVPSGCQLVLVGRTLEAFPIARLVSQDRLFLLRRRDLAMDDAEAGELLASFGLALSGEEVRRLNQRSEGWPAGLALVAKSIQVGDGAVGVGPSVVGAYLRTEWLGRLSAEDRRLLVRASILDRLSGLLCDAVVERSGSAARLVELEAANQLVTTVAGATTWFRVHHLLRDELRYELDRTEPERVRELHSRAASWFEANEDPEAALEHALAGRHVSIIDRLLPSMGQRAFNRGRVDTFRRWYDELEAAGMADVVASPTAFVASVYFAQCGEAARSEGWAGRALREPTAGGEAAETSGLTALGRALVGRLDAEAMLASAGIAAGAIPPGSPWRVGALATLGIAELINDRPEPAERHLDEAIASWTAQSPALIGLLTALGVRAALALDRGANEDAASMIGQAREAIATLRADSLGLVALIDGVEARLLVRHGSVSQARARLSHGQPLRGQVTWAIPVLAVLPRLHMARAYLALSDTAGARTVMSEVRDILYRRPRLGALVAETQDLERQIAEMRSATVSSSALTAAELRLLPLLSTHLTFKEIAERIVVSPNTIKTQAISIYRKLDASSRSEAVERAVEVGLLDPSARVSPRRGDAIQ
jgi:LuxR family maltose regulon positive regulatory protein